MPAEHLYDENYYKSPVPPEDPFAIGGVTRIILNSRGEWTESPLAVTADVLTEVIGKYINPNLPGIRTALATARDTATRVLEWQGKTDHTVMSGLGLFHYYGPNWGEPDMDGYTEDGTTWQGGLIDAMREAGLEPNPIPKHLNPSILTPKSMYLDYGDQTEYGYVDKIAERTYLLCGAVSTFAPGLLYGETAFIYSDVMLAINGGALLELVGDEPIHKDTIGLTGDYIFTHVLNSAVRDMIEPAS